MTSLVNINIPGVSDISYSYLSHEDSANMRSVNKSALAAGVRYDHTPKGQERLAKKITHLNDHGFWISKKQKLIDATYKNEQDLFSKRCIEAIKYTALKVAGVGLLAIYLYPNLFGLTAVTATALVSFTFHFKNQFDKEDRAEQRKWHNMNRNFDSAITKIRMKLKDE